jgi:hypothetical protein
VAVQVVRRRLERLQMQTLVVAVVVVLVLEERLAVQVALAL